MTIHSRSILDRDLHAVQDNLLRMGDLIDHSVERAMVALENRDVALARQIVLNDAQVNTLRFKVEEECLTLLATQQPAARDLRAVVAAMIIASELERMGDYAAGIAKTIIRMGEEPLAKPLIDLPHMAMECRAMLRAALDAYVAVDAEAARRVAHRDDILDEFYNQIFRDLLAVILHDPSTTSRALYLLFSAHNLERIGDRVVNIVERVIFMTSGELKELNAGPEAVS